MIQYIDTKPRSHITGNQLGIFEGSGSIHEKGHTKTFQSRYRASNAVFQTHQWRKYCGRFTAIVALKVNDPYCYFLSR